MLSVSKLVRVLDPKGSEVSNRERYDLFPVEEAVALDSPSPRFHDRDRWADLSNEFRQHPINHHIR